MGMGRLMNITFSQHTTYIGGKAAFLQCVHSGQRVVDASRIVYTLPLACLAIYHEEKVS